MKSSKLSSLESSTVLCFEQGCKTKCHPCLFLDTLCPASHKEKSLPKGLTKERSNNLKMCFPNYSFAKVQDTDGCHLILEWHVVGILVLFSQVRSSVIVCLD